MSGRQNLAEAVERRRRAEMVAGLRQMARPAPPPAEACDLCGRDVPEDHRHMLNMEERQIVCVCEGCWALRSGDSQFRPVGTRKLWLDDFRMPDDVWASFGIPIGLAFFLHSTVTNCVVALYPSPAGATESELHFETWGRLRELNPVLDDLEPDAEALIVNRMSDPAAHAIAPIDRCYMLVGLIKQSWEGISGGPGVADAVSRFFEELRSEAVAA